MNASKKKSQKDGEKVKFSSLLSLHSHCRNIICQKFVVQFSRAGPITLQGDLEGRQLEVVEKHQNGKVTSQVCHSVAFGESINFPGTLFTDTEHEVALGKATLGRLS